MTVTLNQAALELLLNTEDGPVGRFVAEQAEIVVDEARQNVREYYRKAPSLTVAENVNYVMDGSSAIIGIEEDRRKSKYLAQIQSQGRIPWLTDALLQAHK